MAAMPGRKPAHALFSGAPRLAVGSVQEHATVSHAHLVPVCIPSLAALLLKRETDAGHALSRDEVIALRDAAPVIMMAAADARRMRKQRGYEDIDPKDCWRQWQCMRLTLGIPPAGVELPEDPTVFIGQPWRFGRLPESGSGVEAHFDEAARVQTLFLTPGTIAWCLRPRGVALLGAHRADATRALGTPAKTRMTWDRFHFGEVGLHLDYHGTQVSRVSLMWLPGLPAHLR
jgi:hypothetical protein